MTTSKKYTVQTNKMSPKSLNIYKVWVKSPRGVAVCMMSSVEASNLESSIVAADRVADMHNRSRGL